MTESANPVRDLFIAREAGPHGSQKHSVLRAVKFAFAAVLAGSRTVPLGDNSQVTQELAAYGNRAMKL
jgi:hypothetical protein